MLAYDMPSILSIVPDAVGFTKQASFNEEYPLDSADSVAASALRVQYLTKVAGQHVDYSTQERVQSAVQAFGLEEEVAKHSAQITKYASAKKNADLYSASETASLQEEILAGSLGYGQDLVKVAAEAGRIVSNFDTDFSETTLRYSASMPFGETELLSAIEKRAHLTKDERYFQIHKVIEDFSVQALNSADREKRAHVALAIASVDQEIHYNGDIYREAFVKEASVNIKLHKKTVSFIDIQRLGKDHIGDILGKDVASALTGDAANDKAVLESLPMNEKAALERFL